MTFTLHTRGKDGIMRQDWHHAVIPPDATLVDALKVINATGLQIALVADAQGHLLGTVTDGDIRRGLLAGAQLDVAVSSIMNPNPAYASVDFTQAQKIALLRSLEIFQLPVVDAQNRLVGLETLSELTQHARREEEVVLMAGGFGKRLKERTQNTPKPLLAIGGKPILETILESFVEHGFHHFTISVGYLAEQIKDYFGDGEKWGVSIRYIHETEPLGTAGALALMQPRSTRPFFVMNGDVLTKVNFLQLLQFHEENNALATMCVRGFSNQIPYGVVRTQGADIVAFEEKPVQSVMVNAGIYVLQPQAIACIPPHRYFDMPSLFDTLRQQKRRTVAFPIHEYWIDVGSPGDFERADAQFDLHFGTA